MIGPGREDFFLHVSYQNVGISESSGRRMDLTNLSNPRETESLIGNQVRGVESSMSLEKSQLQGIGTPVDT